MTRTPKDVGIIGATGSVGRAALWICEKFPDRFRVRALAAQRNVAAMESLVRRFNPEVVVPVGRGGGGGAGVSPRRGRAGLRRSRGPG